MKFYEQIFLTLLFDNLLATGCDEFCAEVKLTRNAWVKDSAATNVNNFIANFINLYTKYKSTEERDTESTSKDATIIALATTYKTQKDENSKLKVKANRAITPVPKSKPQGQSLLKGPPKWRTTKFSATIKNSETGAKFTWCPHHVNKVNGGVQPGMYMPSDHEHTQWASDEKIKAHAWRASINPKRTLINAKPLTATIMAPLLHLKSSKAVVSLLQNLLRPH